MFAIVWTAAILWAPAAPAGVSGGFAEYRKRHALDCVGPFDAQANPEMIALGDKTYELDGSRLRVRTPDPDDEVRFGVLSSIKDWKPDTQAGVRQVLAWFEQEKIEWLVLNGDIGDDEEELEELLDFLGGKNIPMLVSIGNYESRGSYYRAVSTAAARHTHVVDQNLVRVIEADDVTILSMPGYHDRRFLHTGSGCLYRPEDTAALLDVAEKLPEPKLLIAHGPPRGHGSKSIDVVLDGRQNVGDPALTRVLKAGGIAFGIFGHILESAGRAVAGDFASPAPRDTPGSKLYVNVGGANALPTLLLDGSTMYGSAAVVVIKGKKAKWKPSILRAAPGPRAP